MVYTLEAVERRTSESVTLKEQRRHACGNLFFIFCISKLPAGHSYSFRKKSFACEYRPASLAMVSLILILIKAILTLCSYFSKDLESGQGRVFFSLEPYNGHWKML